MKMKAYSPSAWTDMILLSLVYVLYFLFVTAPIGFLFNCIKVYRFRRRTRQESATIKQEELLIATHHEWLMRSFVGMLVMTMASLGTFYYLVGIAIAAFAIPWWLYRLIRGLSSLLRGREMPASICTTEHSYEQTAPTRT